MILIEVIGVSVLVGLIFGGDLRRLGTLTLRYSWLVLIAFLTQFYVVYFSGSEIVSGVTLSAVLLLSSYLNVLFCCGLNLRLPGMPLIILGLVLNAIVIAANGGFMPVTPDTLQQAGFLPAESHPKPWSRLARSKDVILPALDVRLGMLSDTLILSLPLPFRTPFTHNVFSVGDVVMSLGAFVALQYALGSRLAVLKLTSS